VEYNKNNVASMAQMIKGTVDEGLSKRAHRAFDESMEAAKLGWQKLDGLQTRLEFHSVDLEAGSYLGGAPRGGQETGGNPARSGYQPRAQGKDKLLAEANKKGVIFISGQAKKEESATRQTREDSKDLWSSPASCRDGGR
jgi:hypothetical protein